ncbi:unnamed protein product [Cylicocyclus nassatus]|uniref:RNA helicase n=1 Tax=Cylicocyclus nassatus TaxID=53992 RepID=A0AA36H386_CYLNA|nr:unnamed protein product [Cylicocyclus nassatus]
MEFHEVIDVDANQRTDDVKCVGTFESLMISPSTVANLRNSGFRIPSPVQLKAIPTGIAGIDMLVQAKSGTGKTLVFAVLAVENLNLQSEVVQKIIVAPTREIATQIKDVIRKIAHFKTRIGVLVGGTPVHLDVQALKRGVHIVVGTTGRICQMAQNGHLNMENIDLFVLDEADKLMEDCFQKDINYLFSALPPSRQVAVFSATYPRGLDQLLCKFMRNASLIRLNSDDVQLIGIKQYALLCDGAVSDCLVRLLKTVQFSQALIFCNLHQRCEPIHQFLEDAGFIAASISAQISQKDRDNVIERLKQNKLKVLVSTDLTARGIDASNVNLVVSLETAISAETYFHRIGRAARYGGYGAAVSLLADHREFTRFKAMVMKAGINVRLMGLAETPPDLTTNQSYFEQCPKLSSVEDAASLLTKEGKNTNDTLFSGSRSDHLNISPSSHKTVYDRSTIIEIGRNSGYLLAPHIIDWVTSIGLSRGVDTATIKHNGHCAKSVHTNCQMEPEVNKHHSSPSLSSTAAIKYKFIPSRAKAKKKFYMRGELLSIRDSVTMDCWKKYAQRKFDMSVEPFVDKRSLDILTDKAVGKKDSDFDGEEMCLPPTSSSVGRLASKPVKRYSRKDLIAIQNAVPKKAWLPYVKARWETNEEPFELNQYLRCSFEEQLRRKRDIEKKQRTEMMKIRQKAQMEKPKLCAFSRTSSYASVRETSFETFSSRIEKCFAQLRLANDGSQHVGPVVPLRDSPDLWGRKVRHYISCLNNHAKLFNYDVQREAGRICEGGTGVGDEMLSSSMPSTKAEKCESSECLNEAAVGCVDADMVEDPPSTYIASSAAEQKDHPMLTDIDNLSFYSCQSYAEEATEADEAEDENNVFPSLVDSEKCSSHYLDTEDSFLSEGEEAELERFAQEYKRNVDFGLVFSSYLHLLKKRYH